MASAVEQFISGTSFDTFKKAEDLKKRILFTLAVLIVYRIGTYIPLPYINPEAIQEFTRHNVSGILGILDMFSGGAVGRMTIFAMNVVPYISASIIVQLLSSISPYFEALKKEGEIGRRKLNQYTRYGTVLLACIQSYGIAIGLEKIVGHSGAAVLDPGMLFRFSTVVTLTGGTLFIMWLGEQITSRGIGNGISLIIYSGIVANLPQALLGMFELGRTDILSIGTILAITAMVGLVIAYVVFMEKAQRRLLIQYPKRQLAVNRPATAQFSHLPLKLNSAGVIPPIFASSLLLLPATLTGFSIGAGEESGILSTISLWFGHGKPAFIICYSLFIFFFSFFYTAVVFNPKETADNLKKMGSFIPGIRPGEKTAEYLDYILTRLTVVGAVYLVSVCVLPEFILAKVSLPFYLGGTSLLIVVGVTIDTISQVQSHLLAHQYEGLIKKAKLKGIK